MAKLNESIEQADRNMNNDNKIYLFTLAIKFLAIPTRKMAKLIEETNVLQC